MQTNIFNFFFKEFSLRHWRSDLSASLAVFLVAIPLCLGIAQASGTPLLSGLIAGVIGGLLIGALSRSPLSVSGPAAGLTAIVASAAIELGNFQILLVAIVLAGIMQIIFGLLRAGTFGRYIPLAVIEGMLAAIGLTLILKQIPHLLGYDVEAEGLEQFSLTSIDFTVHPPSDGNTFSLLSSTFTHVNSSVMLVGLSALLVILLWDKVFSQYFTRIYRVIPSSLLAVILGSILASFFALQASHLVQIPAIQGIQDFIQQTSFPSFSALFNPKIYRIAFTIAFVASIESILSVEAIDKLDPQHRRTPVNRELFAQGVGNMMSGLLGGLPVTSVIVRSSVNLSAGATTKLSCIFHGLFLILAIILFAPFINQIPLAALAAVLIFTGFKLTHPKLFIRLYKNGWSQFIPFLTTVIAILFSDLMIGVLIGLAVSFIFILHSHCQSKVITVINHGALQEFILNENLTFLNKQQVIDTLEKIPEHSKILINGSKTVYIDHDILETLQEFVNNAHNKNIEILVGGLPQMKNYKSHLTDEFHESYTQLLSNNKNWVAEKKEEDGSQFFKDLAKGQSPQFLFVGCSDSRVPIEILTKAEPGDIFVHRNIANTVSLTDANFLSVLEYAVTVLRVKHIIVCGHYECGGIKAALSGDVEGVIGHWISQIKDVYRLYEKKLDAISDLHKREKKLIELNVIEQVKKIQKTLIVRQAVKTFGFPNLHGWVYDLKTGLIKELDVENALQIASEKI